MNKRDKTAQMMQDSAGNSWGTEAHFQAFADLIRADEREALETKDWTAIMREGGLVTWGDAEELGERVRAAIRARGNT